MGSCFIVVPLDAARARDPRVFESTDARPDWPVEWASRERSPHLRMLVSLIGCYTGLHTGRYTQPWMMKCGAGVLGRLAEGIS